MILDWVTNGFSKWLLSAKIQLDLFFFFVLFVIRGRKQLSEVEHSFTFPVYFYSIPDIRIRLITRSKKAWLFYFFRGHWKVPCWQRHKTHIGSCEVAAAGVCLKMFFSYLVRQTHTRLRPVLVFVRGQQGWLIQSDAGSEELTRIPHPWLNEFLFFDHSDCLFTVLRAVFTFLLCTGDWRQE